MQLIAHGDLRGQDLAHLESPFFACSKVRFLLLGCSSSIQRLGVANFAHPAPAFNCQRRNENLLREIEVGSWFLVIPASPGPFRPAVRWQSSNDESEDGRWAVDESLPPGARFRLEHAIARIEREKRRSQPQQEIIPISGNSRTGILKRYANFFSAHNAFPEHLTAAEEKGWGSRIRSLYDGNDTIQNQADITAFNDTPSVLGVTQEHIFDAMENVVAVAGLVEGGLGLSRLRDLGRVAEEVSSGLQNQARIDATIANKINGGVVKVNSRDYLSEVETSRIPNQQGNYTCGPACGIVELKKYGIDISEAELADLAGTKNKYGTDPTRLAEALNKKLPVNAGINYRGGYLDNSINNPERVFDELTENGQWIMQTNSGNYHYIVVDRIDDDVVTVLDPWRLERPAMGNGLEATIAKDRLLEQWMHGDLGFIYPAITK